MNLVQSEQQDLLLAARLAIEEKLFGKTSRPQPDLSSPVFSSLRGMFVTLSSAGDLRGCIGYIEGIKPLREAVTELALSSAFRDSRFEPLSQSEYPSIKIEISVLSVPERLENIQEIQIGRDGLIIERGWQKGVLLPQVPVEWGWDVPQFLGSLCRKAGLEPGAWNNGATLYRFTAQVFHEN